VEKRKKASDRKARVNALVDDLVSKGLSSGEAGFVDVSRCRPLWRGGKGELFCLREARRKGAAGLVERDAKNGTR